MITDKDIVTSADSGKDFFDVAVIGGGAVGCAVLRAVATRGLSSILLEAEADLLEGASKANSAILHTGFDAPAGSIEHRMVRRGYHLYRQICDHAGLPLQATGALLVAWSDHELKLLPELVAKAHANGIGDVAIVDRSELRRREPQLSPHAVGALEVPGESVIDPWSAPLAFVHQAVAYGAALRLSSQVLSGERNSDAWRLLTTSGTIGARIVVNSAGLQGDRVEALSRPPGFKIRPRKGQFLVFEKAAHDLIGSIILKVPTARTKGILLTRTVFGNLLLGPTAEEQEDRRRARLDGTVLSGLRKQGEAILPALESYDVTACYAGLRPATEHHDYQLAVDAASRWITVAGVRSTGLTAALALGEYAARAACEMLGRVVADPDEQLLDWPSLPNLAESRPRPFERAGRKDIVCHCERVTAEEILNARQGPLAAGTLGGLKRRTRAMMGACQGFDCTGRVLELAAFEDGRLAAGHRS